MHVEHHDRYKDNTDANKASQLISACVHCGFCLATCPTYLDSGDERDSPRGRIYLIKNLLESGDASTRTHTHLDRCLTCRSCETTCPSGVAYGSLLGLGRELMDEAAPRPFAERAWRGLLRYVLSRRTLFGALLAAGQAVRPVLPGTLARRIPLRQRVGQLPKGDHGRAVVALEGCVAPAATPATHAAAVRVLDHLGVRVITPAGSGCCGAVNLHLSGRARALDEMRRNIDAWWPHIEAGAEAILSTASACGAQLCDYGHELADDPTYADKAQRVSALAQDITEFVAGQDLASLAIDRTPGKVAVHTPCSLQHGLGQPTVIEDILTRAGFELARTRDKHLCCGSAGSYSILQSDISERLLERKLSALNCDSPTVIATANIGCQLQLASDANTPVVHWLELLAPATSQPPPTTVPVTR